MESFEHVARVWLETKGYVVSSNVKFFLARRTRKQSVSEVQNHGYEVDLVAARADELLLASVKSYFGSGGVHPGAFPEIDWPTAPNYRAGLAMFTDPEVRQAIVQGACDRYGYREGQVRMALVAGKFAYKDGRGERAIREHLEGLKVGGGSVKVYNVHEMMDGLVAAATERGTYVDDPVVMTLRALREAGRV